MNPTMSALISASGRVIMGGTCALTCCIMTLNGRLPGKGGFDVASSYKMQPSE